MKTYQQIKRELNDLGYEELSVNQNLLGTKIVGASFIHGEHFISLSLDSKFQAYRPAISNNVPQKVRDQIYAICSLDNMEASASPKA